MKRFLHVLMACMLVAVPVLAQEEGGAAVAKGAAVDTTGKGYTAAYVIDAKSGRVLFAENEHTPLPTASMAKMMTLLITLEEIRNGRLKWEDTVRVSPKASKMGGSQIYLRAGSDWPVKNLIIATMIQSANDGATALGERIGGSTEAFADMMNARAAELKLEHTKFYDPHGLPNSVDPKMINTMCAHDLAVLGRELMKHPFMRQLAVIPEMPFRNGTLEKIYNPNHLVNPKSGDYMQDATGIKTGYSGPAGYCITASAKRGDMEVISVVMGAKPSRGPLSSFGIAGRLMNEAFVKYRVITPVKKGAVVGKATVTNGRADSVDVVAGSDAAALVSRGEEKSVKVTFNGGSVAAPVKKGQAIGTITVQAGDQTIAKIPAFAAADVAKQPGWKAFWPF